jgi:hypothetical protein
MNNSKGGPMSTSKTPRSKILDLRLALINYPILADKIREEMRQELIRTGNIDPEILEKEVEKKAIQSQQREGLTNPLEEETAEMWERRLQLIRDYLTDFYFAYNLPYSRFEEIVANAVNKNRSDSTHQNFVLTFNPELTPWYILFEKGEKYETYPPELYETIKHHHRQIIVVLIKSMVSDQLAFVHIARDFFSIFDLKKIKQRKIGRGKIGGKAAGMYLAYKILIRPEPEDEIDLTPYVSIPETYFLGSDVYYDFKAVNSLEYTVSQKYRSRDEIEREYPRLREDYVAGQLPEEVVEQLRKLLSTIGNSPIIVRSSSLLEDNFGSAFAGKYDSYFLPNQGPPEENLAELTRAIAQVYASVLNPDALFYRQKQGLEDYDERMGILIQKVEGHTHGKYFFPFIAGVGFSRNPFLWNKKLRPEDGFLRIVCGLGTRAVDRVDRDYPRMIGLSHPMLRPVKSTAEITKYSQRLVDVINLEKNCLESLPVSQVISDEIEGIQYVASLDEGDFVKPIFSLATPIDPQKIVLTFDNLLKNTDFVVMMKTMLAKLERHYNRPVDVEFTIELIAKYPKPEFKIHLLQCRPLSNQVWAESVHVPEDILAEEQIFSATQLIPQGVVEQIKYIIFIDPVIYGQIPTNEQRMELARIIGKLNQKLEGQSFILMGPGRWGSSNIDLGVKVSYADIYNARMLLEIAVAKNGATPEVSYGTHFFQDLVESKIFPLALFPDTPHNIFNRRFLNNAPNELVNFLPNYRDFAGFIKLINVPAASRGKFLRVVMNMEESKALGYLCRY